MMTGYIDSNMGHNRTHIILKNIKYGNFMYITIKLYNKGLGHDTTTRSYQAT